MERQLTINGDVLMGFPHLLAALKISCSFVPNTSTNALAYTARVPEGSGIRETAAAVDLPHLKGNT